ncbi:MAG: VIT domain-containing protein [Anaerolineae bacterium]
MKSALYRWWIGFLVLIVCLTLAEPALADGIIIPEPPPAVPITEVPALTIRYHHVEVHIEGAVAETTVDQVFVNESKFPIEGIYIFPLPEDAAISQFDLFVDGQRLPGKLLDREEARRIYEDIVRRRRDPALLEYVGRGAFQARIFPIPAGGERRVQISYTQTLHRENDLYQYVYPLNTERFSARPIQSVSISVDLVADAPLRAIYSPSHEVAVERLESRHAHIGWEANNVLPDKDFALYFSTAADPFAVNLLSYRPAGEDGFFLLFITPDDRRPQGDIIPRDVVLVLDTSGSMQGQKIEQAKTAARYIAEQLRPEDRFNIIDFSTGVRSFSRRLEPASKVPEALRYIDALEAVGGTNIHRALLEALALAEDPRRPFVILFLTDGLPTEGVTDVDRIIQAVDEAAGKRARIFAFGVGYDVNTLLLDTITQRRGGTATYVRPEERIDEKVSALYAKINAPLLVSPQIDFGDLHVMELYPDPLPDIFLGSQLVIAGRYRAGGTTTITLRGEVNGTSQQYVYEGLRFTDAGGPAFVARLWATRKVGYLLDQIRLHGENREWVEALIDLSVRYGIITPYTSFLVEEPEDALTEAGRAQIIQDELRLMAPEPAVGAGAVGKSMAVQALRNSEQVNQETPAEIRHVGERAFILRQGVWTDTRYDPSRMKPIKVAFASPAYFQLLEEHPECSAYLALGRDVIFVTNGQAYQVVSQPDASAVSERLPAEGPVPPHTPIPRWLEQLQELLNIR